MNGCALRWLGKAGRLLVVTLLGAAAQVQATTTLTPGVPAPLVFEVQRNAVVIGTHCVTFSRESERLRVDVMMDLQVPIALWFDYSYRYSATEWWQAGRLDALRVHIQDGADQVRIDARTREGRLEVDGPQGLLRMTRNLLPSNHWNAAVLHESQLLNTLTGGTSALDVTLEGRDRIPLAGGEIEADRYLLGGDLADTRVWYDPEGLWRGLEFSARDGSFVRLYPRDIAALAANTTEPPWSRNPVCRKLTGPLSG
ncbi:DUF6134 family protein [Marinobacterium sedimentorum]|uniref:DUF6134 family protein n=1 Tax=Marinobacterium sedimentorum TaxID=2927804 RepID=UPI0020C60677|nr:DUF6134 family protein [Marinobacterium sedimentorum]MCP8688604.1 DUF6134 family protein [Marinobacterium sedimentorum]